MTRSVHARITIEMAFACTLLSTCEMERVQFKHFIQICVRVTCRNSILIQCAHVIDHQIPLSHSGWKFKTAEVHVHMNT